MKPVSQQIQANGKAELCAFVGGEWLRVSCTLVEDDRREARAHMLDSYPNLRGMYNEDDGNCVVYALENATAVFSSFTKAPETITF